MKRGPTGRGTRAKAGTRQGGRCRLLLALVCVASGAAGCATGGPNHVYATVADDRAVHDLGPTADKIAQAVPPRERVLGLAYDFNTDHLFLRLAPAQVIRVIERPSGKILREMPLPLELRTENSADLAIRSSDRHLFAVHPDGRSLAELTLRGGFVRRIQPAGVAGPVGGLAFDQRQSRLLVLTGNTVRAFASDGRESGSVALRADVRAVSLGYDSAAQHYFAPLADRAGVGEFDAAGVLLKVHPVAGDRAITGLDAGPRSLVRVF